MRLWKWIGVAGLAGVAATGVVVARNERQRRAYTPEDVRQRLHERAASIHDASIQNVEPVGGPPQTGEEPRWRLLRRLRRKRT
jgi:hypothetical protein